MSSSNRINDTSKATTTSIGSNSSPTSVTNIDDSIGQQQQKFRHRKSSNSNLNCVTSNRSSRATSASSKRSSQPLPLSVAVASPSASSNMNNTVSDAKTLSNDIGSKKLKTCIELISPQSPSNDNLNASARADDKELAEIFSTEFDEHSEPLFPLSGGKTVDSKKSNTAEADRHLNVRICETQKIDDQDGVQDDDDDLLILDECDDQSPANATMNRANIDRSKVITLPMAANRESGQSQSDSNHSDVRLADIAKTTKMICDKIDTMQNAISKLSQSLGSQQDHIRVLKQVQARNNACSGVANAFPSIHAQSRKLILLALDDCEYHPIYFEDSNANDLKRKLFAVLSLSPAFRQKVASSNSSGVVDVVSSSGLFSRAQSSPSRTYVCLYFRGPRGISVRITDELVRYEFAHNSRYFAEIIPLPSAGFSSQSEIAARNQFKIVLQRCNDNQ